MEKNSELLNTKVGLEIEFVRDEKYTLVQIRNELQKLLNVKINIENVHHSEFKPTDNHFKMEPDFSLGDHSVELITGPMDYLQGRIVLMKILGWLRGNKKAYTTERCGLHLNVNYPKTRYIADIDILKYILLFDEEEVYSRFPKRRNNLYTKSIKEIVPLHSNFNFENITTNRTSFTFPNTKYYGVNFEKLAKGYLEFRYIGGKNYEDQQSDILDLLDYFLLSLKNSYESNNDSIKEKLIKILEPKKKVFLAGQSYFNFKNIFRNIEIKVDTKNNEEILKLFFPIIWKEIFPILIRMAEVKYNMSGIINYDTDNSTIEISGFILRRSLVQNPKLLFHECKLMGMVMIGTQLHNCTVSNSDIDACKTRDTNFKDSRVKNETSVYCEFKNCYLDNVKLIDSFIDGGVFRKGEYSTTEITDATILIKNDCIDLDKKLD